MRAVFFGTPDIAVPALSALAEIATVTAVVCQPDRPAGRGLDLKAPAVKVRALELGIEVVQPTKVRTPDFAAWLVSQNADVALVMAYGRILPIGVLEAPRRGCMNLHASLLPRYRGAAPITWSVVNGETETGIALMQMDVAMDTGPVYSMHRIPIGEDETAGAVSEALARLGADVVKADLRRAVDGELTATPQDETLATMARMLDKADGRIDFTLPAKKVHDHVRGMSPWPGAFTRLSERTFKVLESRVEHEQGKRGDPGAVRVAEKDIIEVACGEGSVRILRGQLEGKKPLGARDLVAGRAVAVGATFERGHTPA